MPGRGRKQPVGIRSSAARSRTSARQLHEAAWPDMFANLHIAYAELTRTQSQLERRATEIEEARDLFQRVIESMSEALFLLDRAGRMLQVNPAAALLLERNEAELVGRSLSEALGTAELPANPWQLLERSQTGMLRNLEIEIPTGSGHTVAVSASCGLIRDNWGKIAGMLVVARDITERKQAEEALARHAEELARSNAELEQFAYVASHDLQEPLRMMASFAQLLQAEYQARLDSEADEYIGYIVDGATRMQRLINDLLAYSRVGTRGNPFVPTESAVVLAGACSNLRAAIEESQATLQYGDLPVVLGDETQLVQLFQNLIGNAIKFRKAVPVQIEIGARRQGDQWLFWIRDNGIGIDLQYADRIFMIFQRLHTRMEYPGTGIGLAICKKIVERHGGRIWIDSEPGQGTTFFFTLPVCTRIEP